MIIIINNYIMQHSEDLHINLCIFRVYVWKLNIPLDVISDLEGDTGKDIR